MTPSRSHNRSPKLARAMLARCIPSSVREPVIGDFEEEFGEVVERYGSIRAAAWYWRQAIWSIGACLSGLLGEQLHSIHGQFDMAATQLIRHRRYSIISTAGLVLAFTCCLLLSLYLAHELSYDRYHENGDRIFRVIAGAENYTPPILGPTLQRDDPYVERATRILFPPRLVFRVAGGGKVEETGSLVFGDRETFDIFNWRFKDRMGGRLLEDLRTVVITSSAAARLFKAGDPIGKTLQINDREFVVAGVLQDIPVNSHFRFDFIVNISNAKELGSYFGAQKDLDNWYDLVTVTYVLLDDPRHADAVAGKVRDFFAANETAIHDAPTLQPIADIYLGRPGRARNASSNGSPSHLITAGLAVLLILVVAGINVINLAVAAWRMETGGGKPSLEGAAWGAMFRRFGSEAMLISAIAVTIALLIADLLVPMFNDLTATELSIKAGFVPWIVLGVVVFSAMVGAVAASVPAAFVAKANHAAGGYSTVTEYKGVRFGSVSVTFQFVLASALVFSAAVLLSQLRFLGEKPLGYEPDNLVSLAVQNTGEKVDAMRELKDTLLGLPGVVAASNSNTAPGRMIYLLYFVRPEWEDDRSVLCTVVESDRDFFDTCGIEWLAGDTQPLEGDMTYVLSDAAAAALGWERPEDALGQQIETTVHDDTLTFTLSGVFKEYHHFPPQRAIIPRVALIEPSVVATYMTLRLEPGYGSGLLAKIEREWEKYLPGDVFAPIVLKDRLTEAYENQRRIVRQILILGVVVLMVACFGLFGLATYTMCDRGDDIKEWRRHERGAAQIVLRLAGGFVALLVMAVAMGAAIAYLAAANWLDYFAYHISLGPAPFFAVGSAIVLLGMLIVVIPAVRRVQVERRAALPLVAAPARR